VVAVHTAPLRAFRPVPVLVAEANADRFARIGTQDMTESAASPMRGNRSSAQACEGEASIPANVPWVAELANSEPANTTLPNVLFVRVLGPVAVEVDGEIAELGGPVPRRFFAALAASPGAPMPDETLAELVWANDRPAKGTKRVIAWRLRSALGARGRDYLRRAPTGYMLAVDARHTDHGRFTELVEDGLRLLGDHQPDRAARALQAALQLWRGDPLPELADAAHAAAQRTRLIELREVAVEELHAAKLALGETASTVAELGEAVTAAPFRERRWELLALGLYRSGQQAHALAELRRVRQLLVDELGIEPGPALQSLERRMLDHDPDLLLTDSPRTQRLTDGNTAVPVGTFVPKPLSSFVGRSAELALLQELLSARRMVTLVGPAGVGKTRLAVEYCARPAQDTDTWMVWLGDHHDPTAVSAAVAAALGVVHVKGDPGLLVCRALTIQPGLLVLDNCEHLIDSVAELCLMLLSTCPRLQILATSRQCLGIDGEYVVTVDPLTVTGDHGRDGPAVRLLLDRVHAVRPDWNPQQHDRDHAREICAALDGLPLAIELAAARARSLGLGEIAANLRERFDILAPTPRGSLSRHASLPAAIAWSIDHLAEDDRAVLMRLWPFEGGFTWQAAQAVQPARFDLGVLATLASLLDRSVISVDLTAPQSRYRMLETVRRYCADADPDPARSRTAHAQWVRNFVAIRAPLFVGPAAGDAYRDIRGDLANIRAGVDYDLHHHPVHALRTAASLEWAWAALGILGEGRDVLNAALQASTQAGTEDRANGLLALAIVCFHAGDAAEAARHATAAMSLLGNPDVSRDMWLRALMYRGLAMTALGDPVSTRAAVDELITEIQRTAAPDWVRANAQLGHGMAMLVSGHDRGRAAQVIRAAQQLATACGNLWCQGTADLILAWCVMTAPDTDGSAAREALTAVDRALQVFDRQLNTADALGAVFAGAHALISLAPPEAAVTLCSAALAHSERIGADPRCYAQFGQASVIERMNHLLPPDARQDAEAAGRAMSWSDMLALIRQTAISTAAC
jgi:predicted ATPase/DNA-binding SARP family transcriptional activator